MFERNIKIFLSFFALFLICLVLSVHGEEFNSVLIFQDDSGSDWYRLPNITDDPGIIEQILPYDCSCKAMQLVYYGITGTLVDEEKLVEWIKPRPGYGADAKMIKTGLDCLNKEYGTDVHMSWFWTDEIGGLPGAAQYYGTEDYAIFQNIPGHFQAIRSINVEKQLLNIYNSVNNTKYGGEPGVYTWSFEKDYDIIGANNWAIWAVLKMGAFPPTNMSTVNKDGFSGETIELIANLTNRDGEGEDNESITFKIGDWLTNATTVDGIAKTSYTIKEDPGKYDITATYYNNQSITCNSSLNVYSKDNNSTVNSPVKIKVDLNNTGTPLLLLFISSVILVIISWKK
ncbi:MAG: hypothetical protein LBC39_07605 [Methanobrevibacter sp.]|jgi:hypothetical protein|nr:hypothetical protein [Candidatus Methanovirga aequatorialis]